MNRLYIRRIIVISIFAILILSTAWFFLTHGWVIIDAPSSSKVTIYSTKTNSSKPAETDSGKATLLSTGTYTVRVEDRDGASEQIVSVSPFHTEKIHLSIAKKQYFHTISNGQIRSPHTTPSGDSYYIVFDNSVSELWRESETQTPTRVFNYNDYVTSVAWSKSDGLGVVRINDIPKLFLVRNNAITVLSDISISSDTSIVTDKNTGYWWLLSGGVVSMMKPGDANLIKIRTISNTDSSIIAATSKAIVINSVNSSEDSPRLHVLNLQNGEQTTIEVSHGYGTTMGFSCEWTPDGSRLLVVSNHTASLYSSDGKTKINTTLPAIVQTAIWKDSDTIIYGSENNLWEYSLSKHSSKNINRLDSYNIISGLDQDSSGYFMNAGNSNGSLLFHTNATENDIVAAKLGESNITQISDGCGMFFTNFSKPYIHLQVGGDGSIECEQATLSYLNSISIDKTAVEFVVTYRQ